jgi:hypothetical protein
MPKRIIELPLFDVTARRHGGNAESAAALRQIAPGKERARREILQFAIQQGEKGITTDEVADWKQVPPNAISGRISELKALQLLIPTNRRRPTKSGCSARVLVAADRRAS